MIPAILLQVPIGVGSEIRAFAQSEFFIYVVPFLLTFAITYGLLSHGEIPKDPKVRSVISLLLGFAVLPLAPTLVGYLSPVSSSLLLVLTSILMFVVLLEIVGLRGSKEYEGTRPTGQKDKAGREIHEQVKATYSVFSRHGTAFAFILIAVAALIFLNAGGLELIGARTPQFFLNAPLLFFLIIVFLVVYFVALK